MTRRTRSSLLLLTLLASVLATASPSFAQGRAARVPAGNPAATNKAATNKAATNKATNKATNTANRAEASSRPKTSGKDPSGAERDVAAGAAETAGAGTDKSAAKPVEVKESDEGVKTYKFGTIEVEGRLKAPQILYFLRRVRAEFEAGLLGHRSFLRELYDTRRHPALN